MGTKDAGRALVSTCMQSRHWPPAPSQVAHARLAAALSLPCTAIKKQSKLGKDHTKQLEMSVEIGI